MLDSKSALTPMSCLRFGLVACWCWVTIALSSRDYFLVNYGSMRGVDAWLEPFIASWPSSLLAILAMIVWSMLRARVESVSKSSATRATAYLAISLVVFAVWISRWTAESVGFESIWSVYWLAGWTGLSFSELGRGAGKPDSAASVFGRGIDSLSQKSSFGWLVTLCVLCASWWIWQSWDMYAKYMLGFNDFGHFMQRVANTANGNGMLLETPVLPMFWDHFNPGLLLLVPIWKLYPDATLCFVLQSVSLSVGAIFVWKIALRLGHRAWEAFLWGAAWLMQPVLGQMNLAYSYGWHPISLAIPLLLVAVVFLLERKPLYAVISLLVALSMEEGVFVIAALFCAINAGAALGWLGRTDPAMQSVSSSITWKTWLVSCVLLAIGFVIVFRCSGLAEFQTARFSSLGQSSLQVLLSPVLRPAVFWGQLFREQTLWFVLGLSMPCFLPALLNGWRWILATLLPLGVLLVWEHRPAQSLAFQYASTLLPVFWLASVQGGSNMEAKQGSLFSGLRFGGTGSAVGALATSIILSMFLGQLPFSARTLTDVSTKTYPPLASGQRLQRGSPENIFLNERIALIRSDGGAVLATGRIAAHCVGNQDVETVGQYVQRRNQLVELKDRHGSPIKHYRWIIVDRLEGFQQNSHEIRTVETEAVQAGFLTVEERHDIVIYRYR